MAKNAKSLRTQNTALIFAVIVGVTTAGAAWFGGARTASAPEPARVVEPLSGGTGATAAAVTVNTNQRTRVLKWPAAYTSSALRPPAGTPCSTADLPADAEVTSCIQAVGTYRRCAPCRK
jgi:hypothetical protein